MILAILQARMTSTRLPGKVMRDLLGQPMISRQIERVARARRIDRMVVATSLEPSDDGLAAHLEAAGVSVHRGSLPDVLSRFEGALDAFGPAEHVLRLTADCPLIDPGVIDRLVALHLEAGSDYATNAGEGRSYPIGLDCEIVRASVLLEAAAEAAEPYEREHVTPFIYRRPERYALARLQALADEGDVRWTVDRADDFEFVAEVYRALRHREPAFTSDDMRAFIRSRPDLYRYGGDRRV